MPTLQIDLLKNGEKTVFREIAGETKSGFLH